MKKLYILFALLSIIGLMNKANGQNIIFEESFEVKIVGVDTFTFEQRYISEGWTNEYVNSNLLWRYENGGHTTNPAIPNSRRPHNAYDGEYNTLFEKSDIATIVTRLVTPEIDISLGIKPELSFWYANYERDILSVNNDEIRVYYRSVDEVPYDWILLQEITEPHPEWTKSILLIPDTVRFTNLQFAFEGTIGPGWGACIDKIELIETGIVPKYLESVSAIQATTQNIPTGSVNNPLLRVDFTVKGNDGNLYIDTLIVDALLNSADIIPTNGVKLFYTNKSNSFTSLNQVGSPASIIDGKAVFTDIDLNIEFGYSYLWIAVDIPEDVNHEFSNYKVDVQILQNNLIINGLKYPFTDLNPSGKRKIKESIFFDDFENSTQWALTGEFEIDTTSVSGGLGGSFGNPDPQFAQNGLKVLGTDLTGLGITPGDYENNVLSDEYLATTPVVDCKYYKDVSIQFYRWLNIENADSAKLQIDIGNKQLWNSICYNTTLINDDKWYGKQYSIKHYADRKELVSSRFVLGPTSNTWTFSGWNIDDFAITGTFVHDDAGIESWVLPEAGCGHIAPEALVVNIKNYGYDATASEIPIGYSIDGGDTWVMDSYSVSLAQDEVQEFTFSQLIDLTIPGEYNIMVKTFLTGDQDVRNDEFDTTLYITANYPLPYSQDFESGDDFWRSLGENKTWEFGTPTDTIITQAYSGSNCWVTNLSGNYPNKDSSWLESTCFDFTGIEKPIFECMIWANAEIGNDGLAMYYSLNGGKSWTLVPTETGYGFDWDWYNNPSISSLGSEGWDSVTNNWFLTRQILPDAVVNQNGVRFRMLFVSNDTISNAGFAIDNIRIYDAPTDAGVSAIVSPTNSCYLSKDQQITVAVKNFGIRTIKPSDPIYVSLDYQGSTVLTDTFNVSTPLDSGSVVNVQFSNTIDMFDKQGYGFVAYTHILQDSAFYVENVYNDTLIDTVWVNGETYFSLGPDIGSLTPENEVLDAGAGFSSYNWRDSINHTSHSTQTISVPAFPGGVDENIFSVIIINDSSCIAKDTIKVTKSISNLGVTSVSGTVDTCINRQSNQSLNITITNFSTDSSYRVDDIIEVGYSFINDSIYTEQLVLKSALAKDGGTLDTIFNTPPVFPDSGNYTLKVFSIVYADLDFSNDTTELPIYIFPYPEVEIGNDTIFTANAISSIDSLNAYSNYFNSYKWQDNSIDSIFHLTTNKNIKYYVEVTDTNSCGVASDTVQVIADDWELNTIIAPESACTHISSENITLKLKNNSNNTYDKDYIIPAKIIFGDETTNENIVLTTNVGANAEYTHTLSKTIDINTVGNYNLSVSLHPQLDINSTNNKLYKEFETYGVFYVDLGEDSIVTKQADTILLDASDQFEIYFWNIGWNQPIYQISQLTSKLYKVTVTDEHNCRTSSDSVRILASDVAIDEIKSPRSTCTLGNTDEISFVLHNYGNDILLAGTNMSVFYKIDNSSWIEKTFILQFDIKPDKTKIITISESLAFESSETYEFSLVINYDDDFFAENDTIGSTIFEFESPAIDLGDDIYTTQSDTVLLQAQIGFANYQWQDFSKETYFNVIYPATGTYHCLVNNAYGCIDSDTVTIFTYDISIASVEDINSCYVSETYPTINIQLNSKDTLQSSDEIYVSYDFEGTVVNETVVLTDTFTSAALLPYTFLTPFTVSDTGSYSIIVTSQIDNEVVTDNNSLVTDFRIGAIQIDLGDDIVTRESSVTLNAGVGFESYLWSDLSTQQILMVNTSDKYFVTVIDAGSCEASDTINVTFINAVYEITEILGLVDDCTHSSTEPVSFILKNTGNDTIYADRVIPISFEINSSVPVEESYTFVSNFLPGNSVTVDFSTTADLSLDDEYIISVLATVETAISLDSTINTWGVPNVDLGEDVVTTDVAVEIDAGEGDGFQTYLWSTGEEVQKISVTASGEYWVKVFNAHSCFTIDTINVSFFPFIIEIDKFISPLFGCSGLTNEEVKIDIKNTSSKVAPSGSKIFVSYQLDDNSKVEEMVELNNDMQPNQSLVYPFSQTLSIEGAGNHSIKFVIEYENAIMDNAEYSIEIFEKPVFFDGQDTINVDDFPYELDSKITSTVESYLWNTGETTSKITVNNIGIYSLTIVDDNICEFSDSVNVMFKVGITDIWSSQMSVYPNPGESEISIELPDNIGKVTMKITDLEGKTVYINEDVLGDMQLNISDWTQGLYVLRIYNTDHFGVYQIIKQ